MKTDTVDAKGYATDTDNRWLYPPRNMPPRSVKLQLLTRGGVACHGEWRWDGGFVGWRPLPKRDLVEEIEALEYMENGEQR